MPTKFLAGACACLAALAASGPACGAGRLPVTVVRETRVEITLRLEIPGFPGAAVAESLSGPPGEALGLARTLDAPGGPLRVFLAVTADPDSTRERCRLRVLSDVRQRGRLVRVDRVVHPAPDRFGMLELWSGPNGEPHLVLGYSVTWTETPRIVPVEPGAEPIEFAITVALRTGQREQQLEDRHLTGLAASPVRYAYRRASGPCRPGAPCATESGSFVLELTPGAIEHDEVELRARLTLETDESDKSYESDASDKTDESDKTDVKDADAAGMSPPVRRDSVAQRRVRPGEPLSLELPLEEPDQALVVRIVPWF